MLKINLGCGLTEKDGYLGFDFDPNLDGRTDHIHCDLTKGIPLSSNSVDEVYSRHFVEHLDYNEIKSLFDQIYRVCKKGARVVIIVPWGPSFEGFCVGHKSFITDYWLEQIPRVINPGFVDLEFEHSKSVYWPEFSQHFNIPFEVARKFFFNICNEVKMTMRVKK